MYLKHAIPLLSTKHHSEVKHAISLEAKHATLEAKHATLEVKHATLEVKHATLEVKHAIPLLRRDLSVCMYYACMYIYIYIACSAYQGTLLA
jgi:hypothetical protein